MRLNQRVFVLVVVILFLFSGCIGDSTLDSTETNAYPWERESEYLVDCTVDGDIVRFRYAMEYYNKYESDIGISHIICSFDSRELRGWYKNPTGGILNGYQSGFVEEESGVAIIPAGEKKVIIFVFEGIYRGGELPKTLSAPKNLLWGEMPYSTGSKEDPLDVTGDVT